MNDPSIWIKELFIEAGLSYQLSLLLSTLALVIIVTALSLMANWLARMLINTVVTRVIERTKTQWDDIFHQQKVFTRLSHLAPALVIWFMAGWALKAYPGWMIAVHKIAYIYMIIAGMIVMLAFVEAWHQIYNSLQLAQHRHIKGYVQLVKILVVIVAILIVISVIFRTDISRIITGLGAMAAVLILVFRDTLLGLVASIQLSADNMLRVGDWISIPKREVDGVVIDITLNNVKIQNFDKTIINVPTYSLVNESFQNWKGMEESGVRQIKRSINIDIRSIRFLDVQLREKLSGIPSIKEFIESSERGKYAGANTDTPFFNYSALTNLGVFRFYTETYLKQLPFIDSRQTSVVRHQAAQGNGLPLQVYAFAMTSQFNSYENIQSEIFEHIIAIMGEFGLRVYQAPAGDDLLALSTMNQSTFN